MKITTAAIGLIVASLCLTSCGKERDARDEGRGTNGLNQETEGDKKDQLKPIVVETRTRAAEEDLDTMEAPPVVNPVGAVATGPIGDIAGDIPIAGGPTDWLPPLPPPFPGPIDEFDDFDDFEDDHHDDDDDHHRSHCGNGIVEGGEDCDDGNDDNGDGCDEDCQESCDDVVASLTGSGVTTSTADSGPPIVLGQFEAGFNIPLDVELAACGEVSGHINSIITFPVDEEDPDCVDLDDPNCETASARQLSLARCLEVDGDTAWFAADIVEADIDPRFTDIENAQFLQSIVRGNLISVGRVTDGSPDSRSIWITLGRNLVEREDNAVQEVTPDSEMNADNFVVASVSKIATFGYETEEYCAFRDSFLDDNADYIVRCAVDPTDSMNDCVATGAPACTVPTVDGDGIGFADDGSLDCWLLNTRIQWLSADTGLPLPGLFPNTVLTLSSPPSAALYTIADVEREFEPGSTIVVTDNQD